MTLKRMDNMLSASSRTSRPPWRSSPSSGWSWKARRWSRAVGGQHRRARRRPCRHRHDADPGRPRPRRADEVPHAAGGRGRAGERAGEHAGHPPHHVRRRRPRRRHRPPCAPTVPSSSARSRSTRTATGSASCVAPRALRHRTGRAAQLNSDGRGAVSDRTLTWSEALARIGSRHSRTAAREPRCGALRRHAYALLTASTRWWGFAAACHRGGR